MCASYAQDTIVAPIQAEGFNVYDIRKPCIGPLCYGRHKCTELLHHCAAATSIEPLFPMADHLSCLLQQCACADFSLLDRYLAQDKVREELGVGDRPWQSCSPDVYNDFLGKDFCKHGVVFLVKGHSWPKVQLVVSSAGDIMRNYEDKVSAQLEAGIKVLIYVGTEDWICNWMGNKAWVSSLAWSQREAFDGAEEQVSTTNKRGNNSVNVI